MHSLTHTRSQTCASGFRASGADGEAAAAGPAWWGLGVTAGCSPDAVSGRGWRAAAVLRKDPRLPLGVRHLGQEVLTGGPCPGRAEQREAVRAPRSTPPGLTAGLRAAPVPHLHLGDWHAPSCCGQVLGLGPTASSTRWSHSTAHSIPAVTAGGSRCPSEALRWGYGWAGLEADKVFGRWLHLTPMAGSQAPGTLRL